MRMRVRRWVVLIMVMALVAAACGDRGEDSSGGAAAGDGAPEATDDTAGGDEGAGDYGTLEGVCGPNEGGGAVADAPPEEILGVTDDTINVGTVSDPGFAGRPGLNVEIHHAATAFAEWCNAAGGINGKQIELTLYDAAISNYQPQIEVACENEFALVGSGAVQDNLWAEVGTGCDLIDVAGFSVTPEKAGQTGDDPLETRTLQPVPNPSNTMAVAGDLLLQEEFPGAADRTAVLNADLATLVVQAERVREAWETTGHTLVHDAEYNILGEANWTPFATAIRDADVQFLTFVGEGENLALLQQALQEVGYDPEVTYQEVNFYAQTYLEAAGDAAEGTFIRLPFWPFEEADQNPATQTYLDTVEAAGGSIAGLGVQATSAWLLFADIASACDRDDNLTRSCILEGGAATTDWDGGGLHTTTSPGTNEGASCVIIMQVEDGAFVRHAPTDEDYACPEGAVVELTGDYSASG
jgi:ABC-type branched-subunit amino acid transport system substrate-binding protein